MQRLQPLAAAAPRRRRRRQGPAEDRAGDAAAGRHGPRPAHVPAALRRRGAVGLRRLDAQPAPLRRGHRPGRGRRRPRTAGARLDLHGRRLGRAVGARARQGSQVQRTAPSARTGRRGGQALHRGHEPDVAPAAGGLAELHEEGKVTTFPAIGYEPPDESHFTSRHYWEVGQLDTQRALRLDGALPRLWPANPTTRCRACRSTTRSRRRSPPTTMPVAAVSSPADYTMWAYGLGEPMIGPALETFGALGALSAPSPAYAQARAASYDTSLVLEQDGRLRRVRERIGRQIGRHLSRAANSPNGSPCSRRCSTRACRSNAPR